MNTIFLLFSFVSVVASFTNLRGSTPYTSDAINDKIVDRAVKMLMKNTGITVYTEAKQLLIEQGSVSKALDYFNQIGK